MQKIVDWVLHDPTFPIIVVAIAFVFWRMRRR